MDVQFVDQRESGCTSVLRPGFTGDGFDEGAALNVRHQLHRWGLFNFTLRHLHFAQDRRRLVEGEGRLFLCARRECHLTAWTPFRPDEMQERERCTERGFPIPAWKHDDDVLDDAAPVGMARPVDGTHNPLLPRRQVERLSGQCRERVLQLLDRTHGTLAVAKRIGDLAPVEKPFGVCARWRVRWHRHRRPLRSRCGCGWRV